MKEKLTEELIAMRAARELAPGDYCNLGIGVPLLCASYAPEGVTVQSENGVLGYGPLHELDDDDDLKQLDVDLIDAGRRFFQYKTGMAFFDMLTSFAMIRSGRLVSILGALQVSEDGDAAIHSMNKADRFLQVGGSMDLAWGARRLIIAMTHCTKNGNPKIVRELTMPVTTKSCVDLIVTDMAVIEVTGSGLILREYAPGWTPAEIQEQTGAALKVADDIQEMTF